ncbi:MAG TPA: cupin domain-containing protein [Phenylobacterium sp.]|jgi:hypothetical protein|uniref:cupin domain-containing protein n=1 Tax=Phenylobacterium sp. TaxID=1871053 RepID=UPI002D4635F0|nr:cupin domain-containing protein [Phenylobacterium sp.]HZZ69113.1 cupin domain-containing protein [Phenylobacterium sp.]
MTAGLPPVRRILTGVNGAGRSCIVEDGVSPAMLTMDGRDGYRNNNLWRTLGADEPVDAPDTVMAQAGVLPPPGGTVIRVIDIPPEAADPEEQRRATDAVFKAMFADADHHAGHARHPGMHTTDTIDYAILLQGELVAVMDEDETVMRAGDILIQRGTRHAWANRSGQIARICFVLTDAAPAAKNVEAGQ